MPPGAMPTGTVLALRGLTVDLPPARGAMRLVGPVDLDVRAGECVVLHGPSGSGKTLLLRAVAGLLEAGLSIGGELRIAAGREPIDQAGAGRSIGFVFQHASASMNPVLRVQRHFEDLPRFASLGRDERRRAIAAALEQVGLGATDAIMRAWPHTLSGGQAQRVAIALALVGGPALLLADEPTTALDTLTQARILALLRELVERDGLALLMVTHDRRMATAFADRTIELAAAADERPADPVESTIASRPAASSSGAPQSGVVATATAATRSTGAIERRLELHDIGHRFDRRGDTSPALLDISLVIARGEIVAVIGESGAGKSTLARVAVGLLDPEAGHRYWQGRAFDRRTIDAATRRAIQMVFQDPRASFDPRRSVFASIGLAVSGSRQARMHASRYWLDAVGLDSDVAQRRPAALSGGQLQRAAIARALAVEPSILVCDEIVASLDGSAADHIVELLGRLVRERGLGLLFLSHDLDRVEGFADRIVVMRGGRLVEAADAASLFSDPRSDYTRALLDARPGRAVRSRS